jgi:thiol-disulfide isomerase/thioredoxin
MSRYTILKGTLFLLFCSAIVAFRNDTEYTAALPKMYADSLDMAKYKGKVLVLNFWASWSKASRAENKNVVRVYEKYRQNSKLAFVSVSLDTDDKAWKSAITEDEMAWPDHICDFKKYASPIATQYGVNTLPKLILIDKTGKIHVSGTKMSDIESAIDALMK